MEIRPNLGNRVFDTMIIRYKDRTECYRRWFRDLYITSDMQGIAIDYGEISDFMMWVTRINGVPIENPFWLVDESRLIRIYYRDTVESYGYLSLNGVSVEAPVIKTPIFYAGVESGVYLKFSNKRLFDAVDVKIDDFSVTCAFPRLEGSNNYRGYGYVPDYKGTYEIEVAD